MTIARSAPPAPSEFTRIAIIDIANITGTGRGQLRRSVSRGAAAAFVLRAAGMALAAAAAVVLGRELGPAGYGTYSWSFAWVMTLAVPAALGADQLLVREAAVARERGEWSRLRALLRSTLRSGATLSVAAIALAGVVLGLAGAGLGGARHTALLVALPILPLAALTAVAQGALLGLGRTAAALAPATAGRPAAFFAFVAIAAAAGGLSAAGAVALQLAAIAIAAAAAFVLLRRALPRQVEASSPQPAPRAWLKVSVQMGAASALLALDAQVGLLVLGAFGSHSATGVYAAALQCTAPFALLFAAVRLPLGPVVARLGASGDRERLQRGLRQATRGVAAAGALVATVLILFPGQVLGIFGQEFSGGAAALRLLAIAQLVNALCAFNGLTLIMNGQERVAMRAAFGSLVLDAALCIALVPPLGARGAAIAALVSITARNTVNSTLARRRLGVDVTVLGRLPRPRASSTRP